jgi:uncharacterized membrane protein YkvA (DUF1232 family)
LVQALLAFIRRKLAGIPADVRIFIEIADDESVPLGARVLAGGILAYLNAPRDILPDRLKVVGLVDDIFIMTIGLNLCAERMPVETRQRHESKHEAVRQAKEDAELLQRALGIVWGRLVEFVRRLARRPYRGHTMEEVVQSEALLENLRDDTMEYVAEVAIDPATLDDQITKYLPAPDKIVGMLSDGLDEQESADALKSVKAPSRLRLDRLLTRADRSGDGGTGRPALGSDPDPEETRS